MSWTTSLTDLRTLLSDGPTDRFRFRKRCFGETNGVNMLFKTYEFRRITNFTSATTPLGVYKNGVLYSGSDFTSDSPDTGDFKLKLAPADSDLIEASYYVQWFLDTEINLFLKYASLWLTSSEAIANTPPGLIPAALKYAAAEAYLKMAMRWREHYSEMYRVEDAPDPEQKGMADEYVKMSESFREQATKNRDEYYTRQGQSLQPLFSAAIGHVNDPQPRR